MKRAIFFVALFSLIYGAYSFLFCIKPKKIEINDVNTISTTSYICETTFALNFSLNIDSNCDSEFVLEFKSKGTEGGRDTIPPFFKGRRIYDWYSRNLDITFKPITVGEGSVTIFVSI